MTLYRRFSFFVREMSFPRPKPVVAYRTRSCDDNGLKFDTNKFFNSFIFLHSIQWCIYSYIF